jgi:D-glycero-beta-D-manno-heptose 1-phosphate adenylyltransferase
LIIKKRKGANIMKEIMQNKIVTLEQLKYLANMWRFFGKKIVFTNGCFDIIHPGHIQYLMEASEKGDVLIVAVNTDESVKNIKGVNRPVIPIEDRLITISSLHFVSHVVAFSEDTPINLIQTIQPDVLIKGADYQKEEIVGSDIVLRNGGAVETISLTEGYSTTEMIQRIKEL